VAIKNQEPGTSNFAAGHFCISKSARLGGGFLFRFSALYIAREKRGGASTEVESRDRFEIVRGGDFRGFLKNEEV
jgi:hypothetical protein